MSFLSGRVKLFQAYVKKAIWSYYEYLNHDIVKLTASKYSHDGSDSSGSAVLGNA